MRNFIIISLSVLTVLALLIGAAVAVVAALVPTQAVMAQTEPTPTSTNAPQRTLRINGSGVVSLTPDLATISIGVHSENESAENAVEQNSTNAQSVISALRAAGVAERDIRTVNFSVYPRQTYGQNGEELGIIYVVDNTVQVTVRDLDSLGSLLDSAISAGSNSISGISFDVSNREAAYEQALQAAMQDARSKAGVLAEAAGVTLGAVQTIETYTSTPIYSPVARLDLAEAAAVPIAPGQIDVTVDVTVVFEIQ